MPNSNNWDVSFKTIQFFEKALLGHSKVASVQRSRDILFSVQREDGMVLRVLLLNEYCLGLAAVLKATSEFPEADYIVTGGDWTGYTPEAKEHGRQNSIGIFTMGELFGALNRKDPKTYYKKDADGNPLYNYKNP